MFERRYALIWLAVFSLAGLAACEGPAGVDGPPGADGEDGEDGVDAVSVGTLRGTVYDVDGVTLEGVVLTTSPETSTVSTDAAGGFELVDIPVGAYLVTAISDSFQPTTVMAGVAGGAETVLDITLSTTGAETGWITGTVVDADGDAIAVAEVTASGGATASTGVDGSFQLADLTPGFSFLTVECPTDACLDGGPSQSLYVAAGLVTDAGEIMLSGRPSDDATWVGGEACATCHAAMHPEIVEGQANSAHSRFITEGTSDMVYPDMWPQPGDAVVPVDPSGDLLLVQDPRDADGLVNVVLCTDYSSGEREFLFKFYPDGGYDEESLDCNDLEDPSYVVIPVVATVGGQGNWGEGYLDPDHEVEDVYPNYGEGKQRYWCDPMDVPYLAEFYTAQGFTPDDFAKQEYHLLPVYIMQDGTPDSSDLLSSEDWGTPKFWQKSPKDWVDPTHISMARDCAGCHNTGLAITYQDITYEGNSYQGVIDSYDYVDLNVTCERCHGPGSDHASSTDPTHIISPQRLTTKAANETCGQCHAAHSGKSLEPYGIFKYSYDATYEGQLGNGSFVPGLYELSTFIRSFNVSTLDDPTGSFDSWGDRTHSLAHCQMLPEMISSSHYDNPYQRLACFDCHDAHSQAAGPARLEVGEFELQSPAWAQNELCLACHAGHGPFEDLTTSDVAYVHQAAGGTALEGGAEAVFDEPGAVILDRVARSVAKHMQVEAGMGGARYTPDDPSSPVGACVSCHMPKIGKLKDTNDDAQYHLALDSDGYSAVAEGNVPSHVFDIVWPAQSAVTVPADLSTGHDYEVMPNSCGACHDYARMSGDLD